MNRYPLLLIILLAIPAMSFARQTGDADPAVSKEKAGLLKRLAGTRPDTGRVHALFALADYHWRKEYGPDSIIHYGNRAFALAKKLRYNEGAHEIANLLAQAYLKKNDFDRARSLLPQVSQEQQSRILIRIGEGFLDLPGLKKPALDSALRYFTRAMENAEQLGSTEWKHESLIALGKYYYSLGQIARGKEAFLSIIHDLQQSRELSKEAHIWSEMGLYMPDTDSTYDDQMWAHGTALQLYRRLKDTAKLYSVMEDLATINLFHAQYDTAKVQFLQALAWRKQMGSKRIGGSAQGLGWLCYATGNLEEALQWALMTEKNLLALGLTNSRTIASNQALLGLLYTDDGQYQKALSYFLSVTDGGKYYSYFIVQKTTELYIRLGQPEQALAYLQQFVAKRPPGNPHEQQTIAASKGDIYTALGKPLLAGQYYGEMMALDAPAQAYRGREIFTMYLSIAGAEAHYKMARFYVGLGQYTRAVPYLAIAAKQNASAPSLFYRVNSLRDICWLQYKVDSAAGNYRAALEHYRQYAILNDSISHATKMRQFHQLQMQSETEKKDLAIQQKDTLIKSMHAADLLRQHNLQQARFIRNISIAGILVLLALGGLLYRQYRLKQRANLLVVTQNIQLQHLLKEKEWLLREVHHRVKNNLHTIISLLESQAVYLENDALKAIESSQHRIYAMSLIHQKLYQVDNVKTIEMSQYLPEFIQYLKESFGTTSKIHFQTEIEPVSLDVSVAIPLALIVNEAVTNSIKYAFPNGRKGNIRVAMYRAGEETVLEVADDGIGIDENIKSQTLNSLGVELMKGLSEDINGQIEFAGDEGTTITVRFSGDSLFYPTLQVEKEKEVPA